MGAIQETRHAVAKIPYISWELTSMRNAARVDENQEEIVKALRKIGAAVEVLGLPLDLLVSHRGRTMVIECKTATGKLTKYQREFLSRWPGEAHIVYSPEDAVAAVIGKEAMR